MVSETDKITLDIIISACEKMKKENELSEMGVLRIRKMCDCLMEKIEEKNQQGNKQHTTIMWYGGVQLPTCLLHE